MTSILKPLSCGLALSGLCVLPGLSQMRIDGLVATVGERVLMVSDVRLARDLGRIEPNLDDDGAREALVDRALMISEVDRFQQPDPPPTRVDEIVTELQVRLGRDDWSAALQRAGVDEEHVRALVKDDLRLDAYLRQRFEAVALPGDEEVRQEVERRASSVERQPSDPQVVAARVREELRSARFDKLVADWVAELRSRAGI
jgi:hypothetical protein